MSQASRVYEFATFRLDMLARRLHSKGQEIALARKPFDALVLLLSNAGETVYKHEFLESIWPGDLEKGDPDIAALINIIRRALGDTAEDQKYVKTITGKGYSFVYHDLTFTPVGVRSFRALIEILLPALSILIAVAALASYFFIPSCDLCTPIPLLGGWLSVLVLAGTPLLLAGRRISRRTSVATALALVAITVLAYQAKPFTFASNPLGYGMRPGGPWKNTPFPLQRRPFVAEFESVPEEDSLDAVFGLSQHPGFGYEQFACLARFSVSGRIEAFDGALNHYRSLSDLRYRTREKYRLRFAVDPSNHKYSLYVRLMDGREYAIAKDFAFRGSQGLTNVFQNFGSRMDSIFPPSMLASVRICDLHIGEF